MLKVWYVLKLDQEKSVMLWGLYGIDIYGGIDLNGDLTITGEVINIIAQSSFDYDVKLTFAVGTVIVNSEEVNEIAI